MNDIHLKYSAWFGDKTVTISLPEDWPISVHSPRSTVALSQSALEMKIESFLSTLDLACIKQGEQVVLIVDDISRPTPVEPVINIIGKRLQAANIRKQDIKIVIAGGTHDRLSQDLLKKKLGHEIVDQYQVISHNSRRNLVYLGRTQNSTPIYVNQLLKESRLRIGVGGAYPHTPTGFGGGAKIILGVCGFRTIAYLHKYFNGTHLGGNLENDFRRELEDIAYRVKLNGSVHVMINEKREIIELFCGEFTQSHLDAVNFNRQMYGVPNSTNADIVIANTYPFDATLLYSKKGWWPISSSSVDSSNIIIGSFSLGVGNHGLYSMSRSTSSKIIKKMQILSKLPPTKVMQAFLRKLVRGVNSDRTKIIPSNRKIYYFRPEVAVPIDPRYGYTFHTSWTEILKRLQMEYQNRIPNVVIYPCASMQFPVEENPSVIG